MLTIIARIKKKLRKQNNFSLQLKFLNDFLIQLKQLEMFLQLNVVVDALGDNDIDKRIDIKKLA